MQAFTRAPITSFTATSGGEFSLFSGNVTGTFIELVPNKKIVQKWRLAAWPAGHFSTQTLDLDQGSDSTSLRLKWEGVPVGQEDVAKANFHDYYVLSIKTTFGYVGNLLHSSSVVVSPAVRAGASEQKVKRRTRTKQLPAATWWDVGEAAMPFVGVAVAFVGALVWIAKRE